MVEGTVTLDITEGELANLMPRIASNKRTVS